MDLFENVCCQPLRHAGYGVLFLVSGLFPVVGISAETTSNPSGLTTEESVFAHMPAENIADMSPALFVFAALLLVALAMWVRHLRTLH